MLIKYFGWMGYMTSNSCLDFGNDQDHSANTGILKIFL